MINRNDGYQERQLGVAVDTIAANLTRCGFTVDRVNVDQYIRVADDNQVTIGYVALLVDDVDVVVELTSHGGLAVVDEPDVSGANVDRVVVDHVKMIVDHVTARLITDYGGL